jgi:hypothetical protein
MHSTLGLTCVAVCLLLAVVAQNAARFERPLSLIHGNCFREYGIYLKLPANRTVAGIVSTSQRVPKPVPDKFLIAVTSLLQLVVNPVFEQSRH